MARHSSPSGRHVLETRPAPAHRRAAADCGTRGAVPARRGSALVVAGGALSLAGASAAGWVAATHLPTLVDLALSVEAAPSAQTVTLVALGSPAPETADGEQLAAVDPVAVAATATQPGTAPTGSAARPVAAGPTSRPPAPAPAERPSAANDDADRDADRDEAQQDDTEPDGGAESDVDNRTAGSSASNSDDDSGDPSDGAESTGSGSGTDREPAADQDSAAESNSADSDTETSGGSAPASAGTDSTLPGTPASAPPGAGGRTANSLPSEIIDTGDWYLTLPTGREGSPDLVEGSALARYHSRFFELNGARNGVVFTAGTGGATTSGSEYPRSELREMFGAEKASWDGRRGRHTMEIVQAITRTPQEKPDVIAGQIHGTSDDLMQIHLSGQRLRVKYADGQKFVDLDPNYRLGTMFTVKIESADGRVRVWYNGQLKADLPISSSTSYFKAGVYTNSNPGKGDESGIGQVVIRSLDVRHT